MKAISTKVLNTTNTLPRRIKAYDGEGHYVFVGDEEIGNLGFGDERAHKIAAQKLANRMGWKGDLIGGWTKEGWVFVFVN